MINKTRLYRTMADTRVMAAEFTRFCDNTARADYDNFPDCEAVFDYLWHDAGVSGFDGQRYDPNLFLTSVALLFGVFEDDPLTGRIRYRPQKQSSLLEQVKVCVATGGGDPSARSIIEMTERAASGDDIAVITDIDSAEDVSRGVPESTPVFLHQSIAGDGACLYRSIASAIVYLQTGVNLGRGVHFSRRVLDGDPLGFIGESYDADTRFQGNRREALAALALNITTLWVKFYTYVIGCTSVPESNVDWRNGIVGVNGVVAVSDPEFYLDGDRAAAVYSSVTAPHATPIVMTVPSLECVIRLAILIAYADSPDGSSPASWTDIRPLALALMAVPWSKFAPSQSPPTKQLSVWSRSKSKQSRRTTGSVQKSPISIAAAVEGPWRDFVVSMRQYSREGGQTESWMFGSILARAYAVKYIGFYQVAIYVTIPAARRPVPGTTVTLQISEADPSPGTSANVLYDSRQPSHYDSLLQTLDIPDLAGEILAGINDNHDVRVPLLIKDVISGRWVAVVR